MRIDLNSLIHIIRLGGHVVLSARDYHISDLEKITMYLNGSLGSITIKDLENVSDIELHYLVRRAPGKITLDFSR